MQKEFFMASYDILEAEIDEIKKQLSYLTKNGGNSGSSGNGGSSSQGEDWTLLYDKASEDPNLNLDRTSGIKGSSGIIETFPDLMPYTQLKVYFMVNDDFHIKDFDISSLDTNAYTIIGNSRTTTTLYGFTFVISIQNNKRVISFANCTQISFYTNKYTGISDMKNSNYVYIMKILAR